MQCIDKYSQHSSIILPVRQNGWMIAHGFESCCCHINFRHGACFEQGVPWHSGKLQSVDSL